MGVATGSPTMRRVLCPSYQRRFRAPLQLEYPSAKCSSETLDLRELRGSGTALCGMEAGLIGGGPGALRFSCRRATYVIATIRATGSMGTPTVPVGSISVWAVVDEIIPRHPAHATSRHPYCIVKVIFRSCHNPARQRQAPLCNNGMATHRVYF